MHVHKIILNIESMNPIKNFWESWGGRPLSPPTTIGATDHTYVVAKFELATGVVGKVGQLQRLCNCVNSQIFEGYPRGGRNKW